MDAKKKSGDFENRFFDLLEGTIEGIDKKVDRLSEDTKNNTTGINKVATRIGRLENVVFPEQILSTKDLPAWYRDPAVIKLLTLVAGAVVLLISLIAALFGAKLPGVF